METLRLENGKLHIGDQILCLKQCNLDDLIEAFGYPDNYFYATLDPHYVFFLFPHELGLVTAIMQFQNELQPVMLDMAGYLPGQDRGRLAEFQIELHDFIVPKKLKRVRKRLKNKNFEFVLFQGKALGRVFDEDKVDALCFFNSKLIQTAEKTFLYQLYFWLDGGAPTKPRLSQ